MKQAFDRARRTPAAGRVEPVARPTRYGECQAFEIATETSAERSCAQAQVIEWAIFSGARKTRTPPIQRRRRSAR